LYAFIYDAKRFALYNRSIIKQAPLQLYSSALIFAPERSIIRRQFEGSIPTWIQRKPKVQAYWNAALHTLEGHTGSVESVAFSCDGKQVVSGSQDKIVRLWDVAIGTLLQTLEGHTDWVYSVSFSRNSKQVVSGSDDGTVWLWDAATGAILQTLESHSAFSPSGKICPTLQVSGQWVLEGNTKILWLPPDHRQCKSATWNRNLVLGHSSRRISSFCFNKAAQLVI
jgi:WD40 repeat protein